MEKKWIIAFLFSLAILPSYNGKSVTTKLYGNSVLLNELVVTAPKIESIKKIETINKNIKTNKNVLKLKNTHKVQSKSDYFNYKPLSNINDSCVGNIRISSYIEDILYSYSGPLIKLTSGIRKWSRKSKHYCGHALDIHYSEELVDYLISEKGQNWLKDNNSIFFIEHNRYVNFENPLYEDNFRVISHATGLHIHIEKN